MPADIRVKLAFNNSKVPHVFEVEPINDESCTLHLTVIKGGGTQNIRYHLDYSVDAVIEAWLGDYIPSNEERRTTAKYEQDRVLLNLADCCIAWGVQHIHPNEPTITEPKDRLYSIYGVNYKPNGDIADHKVGFPVVVL